MSNPKYREPSGEGWDYPAEPKHEFTCDECGFEADELFDIGKRYDACLSCAEETHWWCGDCNEYHIKYAACPHGGDEQQQAEGQTQ